MGRRRSRIAMAIMAGFSLFALYHSDFFMRGREEAAAPAAFSNLARPGSFSQWERPDRHLSDPFLQEHTYLKFGEDGLLRGWDRMDADRRNATTSPKERRQLRMMMQHHPIEVLIHRGEERWANLLGRQSMTLGQAAWEYRNRYGRHPPKGFDTWWRFVEDNTVIIVDEFDDMKRDVEPFFALSPEKFRSYARASCDDPRNFHITLDPNGTVTLRGAQADTTEAKLLLDLLEPLASLLPTSVTLPVSGAGLGSRLLAESQRMSISRALSEKRYLSDGELKAFEEPKNGFRGEGLALGCQSDTAVRQRSKHLESGKEPTRTTETTFIHDVRATCDICSSPLISLLHDEVSASSISQNPLQPILLLSKLPGSEGFLVPSLGDHPNNTPPATGKVSAEWESKTISKLLWRGKSTGNPSSSRLAKRLRTRLTRMTSAREGEREVLVDRGGEWRKEAWGMGRLNERYMDVGLVGTPHQCKDGACQDISRGMSPKQWATPHDAAAYKYVLDIDGDGERSRSLLSFSSGSVLVKATVYPEWNSDLLTPWVHYVPAQLDYSDLYSILSFFIGPPDARRPGNDELASQIAENGRKFAEEHWRRQDMQAYMLRLLLEYARLEADNRDAFSYDRADL